jgi:hypothetical protein
MMQCRKINEESSRNCAAVDPNAPKESQIVSRLFEPNCKTLFSAHRDFSADLIGI